MKILIIDSTASDLALLVESITTGLPQAEVTSTETIAEGTRLFKETDYDCIITGFSLDQGKTALDLVKEFRRQSLSVPIIIAVESPKQSCSDKTEALGGFDIHQKNAFTPETAAMYIENAIQKGRLIHRVIEAIRLNTKYVSHITHDIRSPLGAIIQYLSHLIRKTDAEPIRKKLERVHILSRQTLKLAEDILSLSESSIQNQNYIKMPANIKEFLEIEIRSFGEGICAPKHINFKISMSADSNMEVDGPPLKVVLVNLIANAVRFTPEDGTITMTLTEKDQSYLFEVTDNGSGIDQQSQLNLFQRDELKSESSDTKHYGIGLPMSYELVKKLGGELQYENINPHGSRFFFEIPRQVK